jgi:hypothetical protein
LIDQLTGRERIATMIRAHRLQMLTLWNRWECSCGQEMYLRSVARTGKLEREHTLHVADEIRRELGDAIIAERWMRGY